MAKFVILNIDGVQYRGGYWITPTGMVEFTGYPLEGEEQ